MAKHQRQLIREAARAALVGKTAAGERVCSTRVVPYRRGELPAIAVYTLEESVDPDSVSSAPRELARDLDLAIEAAVRAGETVDDDLDGLAWEIERAIHADETLGGTASDCVLSETTIDVLDEGDQLTGVVRLVFRVRYYTYAPDPDDVELEDFQTADIRHSLGGAVETNDQAHNHLENLGE